MSQTIKNIIFPIKRGTYKGHNDMKYSLVIALYEKNYNGMCMTRLI